MIYLSAIIIIAGSTLILISGIGLNKMPDVYIRLSATTKASTLGVGAVLIGTGIYFGTVSSYSSTFIIITFLLLTVPVSAHMLGRAAYLRGVPFWEKTWKDELEGQYDPEKGKLHNAEIDYIPRHPEGAYFSEEDY